MNIKKIKIILLKIKLKYLKKLIKPYDYTKLLRMQGFDIGQHTIFYGHKTILFDKERPWMIKIGDYCKITKGTVILAHDYSRSVLRIAFGDVVGEARRTVIGDNVFIGMDSIIIMGSDIGNNVIIGAGSVVSGKIPDNSVVAGNPAKVIRTLEEHYSIKKACLKKDAVNSFKYFKEKYNRIPTIKEMNAFFPLYLERDKNALLQSGVNLLFNGDDIDDVIDTFLNSSPEFDGYEEFVKYAEDEIRLNEF